MHTGISLTALNGGERKEKKYSLIHKNFSLEEIEARKVSLSKHSIATGLPFYKNY